ncbi:MAG: hypothetical protein GXP59_01725 [Deltaproteobacteria bacterium]|nr:hypothetical protein [Deltaproteobacteria bacterium]
MKVSGLKLWWTEDGIASLYGVLLFGMTVMTPAVAAGSISNASIANALKGEHGQIKFNVRYC